MSDFAEAERLVDASATMHAVRAAIDAVGRTPVPSVTAALKKPLYTVAIGAGVITHAILLQFMPDRLAPVKPMAYWIVVAFGAFVAAVWFQTTRSSRTAMADKRAGTANTRKS